MTKYIVMRVGKVGYMETWTVEADSEEDAKKKAELGGGDLTDTNTDTDTFDVTEVIVELNEEEEKPQ